MKNSMQFDTIIAVKELLNSQFNMQKSRNIQVRISAYRIEVF